MNFRTQFNYLQETAISERFEIVEGESLTVPDMAYTVSEIYERFAQGKPLVLSKNLMYTGDDFTPDMRTLDFTEQDELRRENAHNIEALTRKVEERRNQRRQELEEKAYREKFRKEEEAKRMTTSDKNPGDAESTVTT